ncbi:UDP-2,3-diacylglucosamine diphosphatase [Vibrio sp. HN007]|uniref:UDP-2,3-diacylglucosamine diphosphatase n=1 Tax=Vibrio iocasae TaxID=3098914 RepID=UPI0035D4F0E5
MTTLFISDLHLTPSQPDITHCFMAFMENEAIHADALYVLGDLFEFWVGDDDNNPFNQKIKQAFKSLTSKGVPCYFIQGNRDFLVGKRFGKETGMTILDEVSVIDLYGEKTLILHGDTLCIDDHKYLAYREKVHQPWLQWVYNRLPLFVKKKIVSKVQSDIGEEKKEKSLEIMDVNQAEVERILALHSSNMMIHGHTHRPAVHNFANKTRIVLGDWYKQGSVLVVTKDEKRLEVRDFQKLTTDN